MNAFDVIPPTGERGIKPELPLPYLKQCSKRAMVVQPPPEMSVDSIHAELLKLEAVYSSEVGMAGDASYPLNVKPSHKPPRLDEVRLDPAETMSEKKKAKKHVEARHWRDDRAKSEEPPVTPQEAAQAQLAEATLVPYTACQPDRV